VKLTSPAARSRSKSIRLSELFRFYCQPVTCMLVFIIASLLSRHCRCLRQPRFSYYPARTQFNLLLNQVDQPRTVNAAPTLSSPVTSSSDTCQRLVGVSSRLSRQTTTTRTMPSAQRKPSQTAKVSRSTLALCSCICITGGATDGHWPTRGVGQPAVMGHERVLKRDRSDLI